MNDDFKNAIALKKVQLTYRVENGVKIFQSLLKLIKSKPKPTNYQYLLNTTRNVKDLNDQQWDKQIIVWAKRKVKTHRLSWRWFHIDIES